MKTAKTWSTPNWKCAAIATLMVVLATLPDAGARIPGKVVKPPRSAPPHPVRTLTIPEAYTARASASGRANQGLTASKRVAASAPWTVWREPAHQTPIFLQFHQPEGVAAKRAIATTPAAQVIQFIAERAAMFRLRDPSSELVHRATRRDRRGGEHVQLEQRYRGVPIWGASIVGHWSAEHGLYAINGRYQPSPEYITRVEPAITRAEAIERALGELALRTTVDRLSAATKAALKYRGPEAELYLWNARPEEPVRLTWSVEIRPNVYERWRYFVDAHGGEILDGYMSSPTDGPVIGRGVDLHGNGLDLHTLEDDGVFYLIDGSREDFDAENFDLDNLDGALVTLDAHNTDTEKLELITSDDNTFADSVAVSAHANMERVYEYFLQNHDRRGIAGDGSAMISVVHVTEDGESMENAYWNGVLIAYGDGGEAVKPLAGALDVAAHEMTHGIIERTVNLEYRFQSGALNESFADIFGAMVDDDDWSIGEEIANEEYFPSGAIRDLRDPHNGEEAGYPGWQPAHMDEYQELDEDEDNGGVHVNSGIPNRAAYLVAEAIGREKTAQIYYRILEASYLTARSQFVDCRLAAERAARDLFGDGSSEVGAVSRAYDTVGISVEPSEPEPPPAGAGPGEHWVATVAAGLDGDNSLWLVKPTADVGEGWESRTQLTTTQVLVETGHAITAPVNGDFLLFVDGDNNLRYIGADGGDENVIEDSGEWSSIALSPDGARLVAATVYEDSSIYYFDLDQPENYRRIELYHRTTQDGINLRITRFADALHWDATGKYVIYDAFNSLPGPSDETIDFWTVNVLDPLGDAAWSLFPPQPPGVHIANPSLSRTVLADGTIDDCRLLYERFDEPNGRIEISVMDLCTGEEGVLYTTTKLDATYPGFTNGDREIVFEEWVTREGTDVANLWRLPLVEDGLSSSGERLSFVPGSQSPKPIVFADDVVIIRGAAAPSPDFDGDGTVGFTDFLSFAAVFGLSQGDAGYDAKYDLDGNGSVGFSDFVIFAGAFGKQAVSN